MSELQWVFSQADGWPQQRRASFWCLRPEVVNSGLLGLVLNERNVGWCAMVGICKCQEKIGKHSY